MVSTLLECRNLEEWVEHGAACGQIIRTAEECGLMPTDDDQRDVHAQPSRASGHEIPVDERISGGDDLALVDERGKALTAQIHGVDSQVNEN